MGKCEDGQSGFEGEMFELRVKVILTSVGYKLVHCWLMNNYAHTQSLIFAKLDKRMYSPGLSSRQYNMCTNLHITNIHLTLCLTNLSRHLE